jgi:hypothetical protein
MLLESSPFLSRARRPSLRCAGAGGCLRRGPTTSPSYSESLSKSRSSSLSRFRSNFSRSLSTRCFGWCFGIASPLVAASLFSLAWSALSLSGPAMLHGPLSVAFDPVPLQPGLSLPQHRLCAARFTGDCSDRGSSRTGQFLWCWS